MSFYLYPLLAFVISSAVVFFSTPLVKQLGLRTGRVDLPGHRKVHQQPMVRLGGVAIFLGTVTALLALWSFGGFGFLPAEKSNEVWGVTVGGLACFFMGFMDDLFGLSPFVRLLLQVAIAIMSWQMGVHIDFLTIPGMGMVHLPMIVSLGLTVVWLVGMTNAINWIDGLDGLAAGVSGIAAVIMLVTSLFMNQPAAALIAAALAGSTLGFLRYNFNPAQIFMGDGGSYFIGFTLAGVSVIGLVKSVTTVAVILPYVILAVPILDMSVVILDRLRNGKSPFIADKRHLHHRLLQAGLSHRSTVLFIYTLTIWVGSVALAVSRIPNGLGVAIVATLLLSYAIWQVWRLTRSESQA
jgi:UDP-GlcNAc:undecaprenyl-phosphate/decaprenyl-phosphate GlcNAc-1-phosphate transferase